MTVGQTPQSTVERLASAVLTPTGRHRKRLHLAVSYPCTQAVVVTAAGEIDATTIEHLEGSLWPRLSVAAQVVVVDLTEVEFLSVGGLGLLNQARLRAHANGIDLRLVTANRDIQRALHIVELDSICYTNIFEVLGNHRPEQPEGTGA